MYVCVIYKLDTEIPWGRRPCTPTPPPLIVPGSRQLALWRGPGALPHREVVAEVLQEVQDLRRSQNRTSGIVSRLDHTRSLISRGQTCGYGSKLNHQELDRRI